MPDSLRDSLISQERLQHDPEIVVTEPATVSPGGFVASHRAKVRPPIESYERRGQLTWRQGRAARRLYRGYTLGILGAREIDGASSAHSPGGYTDLQLSAARDYREGRLVIGPDWGLVFQVVLLDATVSACAEKMGLKHGRAVARLMDRLRAALDRLADHHQARDAQDDARE